MRAAKTGLQRSNTCSPGGSKRSWSPAALYPICRDCCRPQTATSSGRETIPRGRLPAVALTERISICAGSAASLKPWRLIRSSPWPSLPCQVCWWYRAAEAPARPGLQISLSLMGFSCATVYRIGGGVGLNKTVAFILHLCWPGPAGELASLGCWRGCRSFHRASAGRFKPRHRRMVISRASASRTRGTPRRRRAETIYPGRTVARLLRRPPMQRRGVRQACGTKACHRAEPQLLPPHAKPIGRLSNYT
jgi:hypothetical protein